jgi:hypothetical protein
MGKNNINIQISEEKEGVYMSGGGRHRLVKGKLYPIRAFKVKKDNHLYYDIIQGKKEIKEPEKRIFGGRIILKQAYNYHKVVEERTPVLWEDIKDYAIVTEGIPLIGAKLTVKLKRMGSKLVPWSPLKDLDEEGITSNTRMVKINDLRFQLYEATKNAMTREDIMLKVVLPMGLIMLAIILVIFFPKMYGAITEGSKSAFQSSSEAVFNWLGQNPPNS